jgi:hypothetical protein
MRRFLVEKGSPNDTFDAPVQQQLGEARGQRAFIVKKYDYGGGVLSDGTATGTEGASPPRSRRLIWR